MIKNFQISECSSAPVSQVMTRNRTQGTHITIQPKAEGTANWKRYRTRIGKSTNQVNLKFEEALPEIQKGMGRSISGLFYRI